MIENCDISYEDILRARQKLQGRARVTPLVELKDLNKKFGGRILFKLESLQVGGAFKFRGALNALLDRSDRKLTGVVACSSGNHAIAVSTAAVMLGVPAIIVMPSDSPNIKLQQTRSNGAQVILYDRDHEDRVAICNEIVHSKGYAFIAPFDDPLVIAGQGTIACEIIEQADAMGARIDVLAVPCSGGGLAAGCALALAKLSPDSTVTTVEPFEFDDMARSLKCDGAAKNSRTSGSICDALLSNSPGVLTLPILRYHGAQGMSVTDNEVLEAMHEAWRSLKVVLEPGGAAALAALTSGRLQANGRTVAVICSGGNVDAEMFKRALDSVGG